MVSVAKPGAVGHRIGAETMGDQATEEAVQEFRNKEGLNDPFLVQFSRYMYKAAFQGDIGRSYVTKRPVADEIMATFPATLKLSALAVAQGTGSRSTRSVFT